MLNYSLKVITEPASEPVSLAEIKTFVGEITENYDDMLEVMISTAREHCESITGRTFLEKEMELYLDKFPDGGKCLQLPRPPLVSVSSITYVDTDGVTQTWASSGYIVDEDGCPARLKPAYGEVWPTVREQPRSVKITYKAGYGNKAHSVPNQIHSAIKLMVSTMYDIRENVIVGTIASKVPDTSEPILNLFKVPHFDICVADD